MTEKEEKRRRNHKDLQKLADLEQKLEGLFDEKTRQQIKKAVELAHQYEDYVNIPMPIKSSRPKRLRKQEPDKSEDLLHNFEDNVFNWDNKATKTPRPGRLQERIYRFR